MARGIKPRLVGSGGVAAPRDRCGYQASGINCRASCPAVSAHDPRQASATAPCCQQAWAAALKAAAASAAGAAAKRAPTRPASTSPVPPVASRALPVGLMRGTWPGARSLPGRTVEPESPVPGLWNVGDGASLWATAGISACAQNAQIVADRILAAPHGATSKKASA